MCETLEREPDAFNEEALGQSIWCSFKVCFTRSSPHNLFCRELRCAINSSKLIIKISSLSVGPLLSKLFCRNGEKKKRRKNATTASEFVKRLHWRVTIFGVLSNHYVNQSSRSHQGLEVYKKDQGDLIHFVLMGLPVWCFISYCGDCSLANFCFIFWLRSEL